MASQDKKVEMRAFSFGMYGHSSGEFSLAQFGEFYHNENVLISYPPLVSFNAIKHDNYNGNNWNYSLSFIYSALAALGGGGKIKWLYPLTYPLSNYRIIPGGLGNIYDSREVKISASAFVQNQIDIFVFKENKWMMIYPTVGIGIQRSESRKFVYSALWADLGASRVIDVYSFERKREYFSFYIRISLSTFA